MSVPTNNQGYCEPKKIRKEVNFIKLYLIFLSYSRWLPGKLRIPLQFQSKPYRYATRPLSALLLTNTLRI